MDIQEDKLRSIQENGYEVNIGEYVSGAWDIFKKNAGGFIGFTLVYFAIMVVLAFIPLVGSLATAVLSPALVAGYYLVAHKGVNGEKAEFSVFFDGFKHFGPLALVSIIGGILVFLASLLLLIPGIYLAIGYTFAALFVVFRGLDFWPALETSRKLITKRWFSIFLFVIVLGLINLLGAIVAGIGLLITIPMTYIAFYLAYRDIFGVDADDQISIEEHLQ